MSNLSSISIAAAQSYASVSTQNQQSLQPFANLDLTESQRSSLRSIFANAKKTGESQADVQKQLDAVLTPAQQQTLASDLKAGPPGGGSGSGPGSDSSGQQAGTPFANLHLTAAQSSSLTSILANAKKTGESQADGQKKIDAILTTAQQATLASDIKANRPPQTSSASDSTTSTTSSSASDSAATDSSASTAVTNVQNQAAAAQAARLNALLQQVLDLGDSTPSP